MLHVRAFMLVCVGVCLLSPTHARAWMLRAAFVHVYVRVCGTQTPHGMQESMAASERSGGRLGMHTRTCLSVHAYVLMCVRVSVHANRSFVNVSE